MSTPKIETLNQDIKDLLLSIQQPRQPTRFNALLPEALSTFGVNTVLAVDRQLHKEVRDARKSKTIYASELGTKCPRKIWYKNNLTEEQKGQLQVYPPAVMTKFMYGDIIENLTLLLVEAAGHKVDARQAPVVREFKVDGALWQVRGKIDCTIDEHLVDVKSTSSYGFKDFVAGTGGSKFGYKEQLGFYANYAKLATVPVIRGVGFLAVDKTLGHIQYCPEKLTPAVDIVNAVHRYSEAALTKDLDALSRFAPEEHTKETKKLCVDCSYCEFKKECWKHVNSGKGIRSFAYSGKVVHLVHVGKEPKVPEITETEDLDNV